MTPRSAFAVVASAAAVLGSTAIAATAAPTTLTLRTVQVSADQTGSGYSSTDTLFKDGKKAGTDTLACSADKVYRCQLTLSLPKGAIRATFTDTGSESESPLKIVGGTKAYAGAKGTGTFTNLDRFGSKRSIVLHLK